MNGLPAVLWNVAASGLPRHDTERCVLCGVVLWAQEEKDSKVCVLCKEDE